MGREGAVGWRSLTDFEPRLDLGQVGVAGCADVCAFVYLSVARCVAVVVFALKLKRILQLKLGPLEVRTRGSATAPPP
eukprot:381568-Prorocentrum_minimum.AAC.1